MNDQTPSDPNAAQETDVWWGAYNGLALLPSLLVSILLTGAIFIGVRWLVEHRHVQWTIWALTGCVWLVQTWRWAWRVFGMNYRLTTRRLLVEIGHVWLRRHSIDLGAIRGVEVQRIATTALTGVGRIVIRCEHGDSVTLDGVSAPQSVAALLRARITKFNGNGRADS